MIVSIGPPCAPGEAWHGCEPAMTIPLTFYLLGTLAMLHSLIAGGMV
jgi:hypothetical protein